MVPRLGHKDSSSQNVVLQQMTKKIRTIVWKIKHKILYMRPHLKNSDRWSQLCSMKKLRVLLRNIFNLSEWHFRDLMTQTFLFLSWLFKLRINKCYVITIATYHVTFEDVNFSLILEGHTICKIQTLCV